MSTKAILHWSGGKDSALSLHKVLQQGSFDKITLLTTVNQAFGRISMHGVRTALLEQQAQALGLPLEMEPLAETVSMNEYSAQMQAQLVRMRQNGFQTSVFGDIFLEDLKHYREAQLAQVDMKGLFPLWQQKPQDLIREFIDLGFKAVLVCVNGNYLDASFAGRMLDYDLLNDLPAHVDVCGENGEYHSFVFDGPIFQKPVAFHLGEIVQRHYQPANSQPSHDDCYRTTSVSWNTRFYYCDLLPVPESSPTGTSESN